MKKYSRRVAIVQTGWKTQIVCPFLTLPLNRPCLLLPFPPSALTFPRAQLLNLLRSLMPMKTREANVTRSWASWRSVLWALASCCSSSQRSLGKRWFKVGIMAGLIEIGVYAWSMICLGYLSGIDSNDDDVLHSYFCKGRRLFWMFNRCPTGDHDHGRSVADGHIAAGMGHSLP